MKKLIFIFIFALCLAPTKVSAADTGWTITSFGSKATIQTDGTVLFTETIAVDFNNLNKHGIYRDIPYIYSNSGETLYTKIETRKVLVDQKNVDYSVKKSGNYVEIKIGDADKTISGTHTYTLSYSATGILKSYESYDELYWNVTGDLWSVPIKSASASVTLENGAVLQASCYIGASESDDLCNKNPAENGIFFSTDKTLNAGEQMTIAVGYTKGAVPILSVPDDFLSNSIDVNATQTLISMLITLALGLFFLIRAWLKGGRDKRMVKKANSQIMTNASSFTHKTIAPEFSPPGNLPPAEMNAVLTEYARPIGIPATIVDLAARGYLTITEIPKQGIFKPADYKFNKTQKQPTGLTDYENYLYSQLFLGRTEILVSDLKSKFYLQYNETNKKIITQATANQYFAQNPNTVRTKYLIIGAALVLVSLLAFFGAMATNQKTITSLMLGFGIALFLLSILTFFMTNAMPAKTAKGYDTMIKIMGYKLFISTTEKYRAKFLEDQNLFVQILPYAIIFGLTDKLAKAFAQMGIEPTAPTWYHSSNAFNMIAFTSAMNHFSTNMNMAVAPAKSGSGGGGFSGGGFGGGGGGSW